MALSDAELDRITRIHQERNDAVTRGEGWGGDVAMRAAHAHREALLIEVRRLRAECERLRAALTWIAAEENECDCGTAYGDCDAPGVARTALADAPTEGT